MSQSECFTPKLGEMLRDIILAGSRRKGLVCVSPVPLSKDQIMSMRATSTISRSRAQNILRADIEFLSDKALEELMDTLASTGESRVLSECDNFRVTDGAPEYDAWASWGDDGPTKGVKRW